MAMDLGLMTIEQAARLFGVTQDEMAWLIDSGAWPSITTVERTLVDPAKIIQSFAKETLRACGVRPCKSCDKIFGDRTRKVRKDRVYCSSTCKCRELQRRYARNRRLDKANALFGSF